MITGEDVVKEARTWIGCPFHDQASLKGVGCDCIGLIRGVGKALGIPEALAFEKDQRFFGYARHSVPRLLVLGCDTYFDPVPIADAGLGHIVLASVEVEPQHFAIISSLDPPRVIHSYIQVGRVVENVVNAKWRSHVLRVYRFRGVE